MTLRITTSRLLQAAISLVHLCNLLTPLVPARYKAPMEAVAVLCNFAVNEISHRSNPDGTRAPALTGGPDGTGWIAGKPL